MEGVAHRWCPWVRDGMGVGQVPTWGGTASPSPTAITHGTGARRGHPRAVGQSGDIVMVRIQGTIFFFQTEREKKSTGQLKVPVGDTMHLTH